MEEVHPPRWLALPHPCPSSNPRPAFIARAPLQAHPSSLPFPAQFAEEALHYPLYQLRAPHPALRLDYCPPKTPPASPWLLPLRPPPSPPKLSPSHSSSSEWPKTPPSHSWQAQARLPHPCQSATTVPTITTLLRELHPTQVLYLEHQPRIRNSTQLHQVHPLPWHLSTAEICKLLYRLDAHC